MNKRLGVAGGAALLLVALWYLSQLYTSDAARDCRALYRAARTAADTSQVDTTVVAASRKLSDPRSCGSLRYSARWQ